MLKGIHPSLSADVLYALRAMGHGDVLAVVDMNFPVETVASETVIGTPAPIANVPTADALRAILSVLPVEAAGRMEVMGKPDEIPGVQAEVQAVLEAQAPEVGEMRGVERFAFYEEAKSAFVVIPTGERRFYGCFLLTKGVIPPQD